MKTIDCRGLNCPEPVLRTKQALEESGGEELTIVLDNEGSKNNVERFARSQGCTTTVQAMADGCFAVAISGIVAIAAGGAVDPSLLSCNPAGNGSLICIIPADTMGRGSDELG